MGSHGQRQHTEDRDGGVTFVKGPQACDHRTVSDTNVPVAPSPIGPLLRLQGNGATLELCVDGSPAPNVAETISDALTDMLPPDVSRREKRTIEIDDSFAWELAWQAGQLAVTVIDPAGSPWAPPTVVDPVRLIDALSRADLGQSPHLLLNLERLKKWLMALQGDDIEASKGGRIPLTLALSADDMAPRPSLPLSVGELHHLAYRRDWTAMSAGPLAVFPEGERIQFFDREGLHILARGTGNEIAHQASLYPVGTPYLALDAESRLTAFGPDGEVRWRSIPTIEGAPKYCVATDEVILIESEHATLSAYESRSGALRWRHRAFLPGDTKPIVAGESVWRFGHDGFLYGLWSSNGELYCRRRIRGRPVAPLLRTPVGLVTTSAVEDAVQLTHYGFSETEPSWQRRIRGRLVTGPISCTGGLGVVIERDGRQALYDLDAVDGHQRAHHRLEGGADILRLDAADGLLLTKSTTGAVQAYTPGVEDQTWDLGPDTSSHRPWACLAPILARGLLMCAGASIRAVDPKNGRLIQSLECAELTPSWVSAWENGDLLIIEDEMLHLFRLHGHLSLIT